MSYSKTINELVEYLNVCRDAYYNLNKPIITDQQYDDLFDKLTELEKESGIVLSNSPTQTVGYTVASEFKKVKHYKPLLSLDKTKSYEDIVAFCDYRDVLFMHKLDGLTIQLTYENGEFVRAETRGDGFIGEDITDNAKTFIGVPKTIPVDGTVRITGEAIINKNDFEYINSKLPEDEQYANPRNLASGSVRQLDSKVCASRKVRFIVWNANDLSSDGTMLSGIVKAHEYGFNIVHFCEANKVNDTSYVETVFNNMKSASTTNGIPIDGIVVMFNDISYGDLLGKTAHHFKNGIAFKFYDEGSITVLENVEYTIGKTGVLTPTAVFSPVELCGTTVTRASVHNISILKKLNLKVGDEIEVYKSNEIIPQVRCNNTLHNNEKEYTYTIPKTCPYCSFPTEIKTNRVRINKDTEKEVSVLMCTNPKCQGRLLRKLTAFVSKQAMDIKGLSDKTLEKFIELGYLNTYADIYTLMENYAQAISKLDGFGDKSVSQLNKSIEDSKNTTFDRVLTALNIDGVGVNVAKTICKYFNNSVDKFLESVENKTLYASLNSIKGLGDFVASNVAEYFNAQSTYNEFKNLVSYLTLYTGETVSGTKLSGKTFVITGSLEYYANRDELVKEIVDNGGNIDPSVKKTTSYLINNDVTSNSSKNKKAKELGVAIISEKEFIDMLGSTKDMKPKKSGKLF